MAESAGGALGLGRVESLGTGQRRVLRTHHNSDQLSPDPLANITDDGDGDGDGVACPDSMDRKKSVGAPRADTLPA